MKTFYKVQLCLFLCVSFSSSLFAQAKVLTLEEETTPKTRTKVTRLELRGDRAFITGEYDAATDLYERAAVKLKKGGEDDAWLRMELKLARVYSMLQNYENSIKHYQLLLENNKLSLDIEDVCTYVDALRALSRDQEAEMVARQFSYTTPYSRNQRYLNTLGALSTIRYFYGAGDSDFNIALNRASTRDAEYWIYDMDGQLFCAVSSSPLMDPRKVFFHRTRFYGLNNAADKLENFRAIPNEVQNGPSTNDGDYWIVTAIDYRGSDRINGVDVREIFLSKLYYTTYDQKRRGWKAPQPLFEDDDASYAHPVLFNEGKSLIFSSNRPGGYGGMDLYVSHRTADGGWSAPVNLGHNVNSDGDEIFPNVAGDLLYFASNGLEGYGGYDIYNVRISGDKISSSSLFHYPYPVNSVYNDYGIYVQDEENGLFISDRRGTRFRDDIYSYFSVETSISAQRPVGVSQELAALKGTYAQLNALSSSNAMKENVNPRQTNLAVLPQEGEILLSIYFDFNSTALSSEAMASLDKLLGDAGVLQVKELLTAGYADEIGSETYNLQLSQRRARAVADYLLNNGIKPSVVWEGRGRTDPDQEDVDNQLDVLKDMTPQNNLDVSPSSIENTTQIELPLRDRIRLNRTARRVDIIVRKVK